MDAFLYWNGFEFAKKIDGAGNCQEAEVKNLSNQSLLV
jgi:hypothetical protein